MSIAKLSIYFDGRRKNTGDKCPVKLRVYFCGQARLYPTGISVSEAEFEASFLAPKPKGQSLQELKIKLQSILAKANEVKDKR